MRQNDITPRWCALMFASSAVSCVLEAAKQNAVTPGSSVIRPTCAPAPSGVLLCRGTPLDVMVGTKRGRAMAWEMSAFCQASSVRLWTSRGRSQTCKVFGGLCDESMEQDTSSM
mmetsp:Transcript_106798/g.331789  ORF Transcript_106798/g.331789 Transcript_106798/m.331789 type:complete len:114 (+) Transcript_106798:941-1282(+)